VSKKRGRRWGEPFEYSGFQKADIVRVLGQGHGKRLEKHVARQVVEDLTNGVNDALDQADFGRGVEIRLRAKTHTELERLAPRVDSFLGYPNTLSPFTRKYLDLPFTRAHPRQGAGFQKCRPCVDQSPAEDMLRRKSNPT
jgi:hypothetical protein